MKKLFTLILLTGAFCGGYSMGHRPGSPDLEPFARDCAAKATAWVRNAVAYVQHTTADKDADSALTAKPPANGARASAHDVRPAASPADEVQQAKAILGTLGVAPEGQLYAQAAPAGHRR